MQFPFRKGQEGGTNWIVISMVIALIVLFVFFVGPNKIITQVSAYFGSCWGGKLVEPNQYGADKTYKPSDWVEIQSKVSLISAKAEDKNKICIIPSNDQAKEQLAQEQSGTSAEEGIQIIVTLDDSITPLKQLQSVPINAYQPYTLHVDLKGLGDSSPKEWFCTLRIIDPKDPSETPYLFVKGTENYHTLEGVPSENTLMPCSELLDQYGSVLFFLKEEPNDRKKYLLQIIVHSEALISALADTGDVDARATDKPVAQLTVGLVVQNAVQLKVDPENWAAATQVTYTCKVPCTDVMLGLVSIQQSRFKNAQGEEILDAQRDKVIYDECNAFLQNTARSGKTKTVHTLPEGITVHTVAPFVPTETPLRSDSGKNSKTFTIDAQTLIQDFERKPPYQTRVVVDTEGKFIVDDYLCFQFSLGKNALIKTHPAPLLIDASPPTLLARELYFQYNTDQGLLTSQTKVQGKTQATSSELIVPALACDDHVGSGCARYSYYYQPVEFNLPVDKREGFFTKIIGAAMNEVFKQLYTRSLSDADCKPFNTGSYQTVSNFKSGETASISLNQAGMGYVCLYATDQAGNMGAPILIQYINPYNLIQQAQNAA